MNEKYVFGSQDMDSGSSCTSHCKGQCVPACSGGGHCVANIEMVNRRRPSRQDMVALDSVRRNTGLEFLTMGG